MITEDKEKNITLLNTPAINKQIGSTRRGSITGDSSRRVWQFLNQIGLRMRK